MLIAPEPLPLQTVLNERYRIEQHLGQGGFGITYRATDLRLEERVVLKELAPNGCSRSAEGAIQLELLGVAAAQRLKRQFQHEGRVLSRLRIKGVVRCLADFEALGTAFLVMENVEGAVPLDQLIERHGTLDFTSAHSIFEQALEILGLIHAHGLVHRDLKPSNLLVDHDGQLYVIDFGTAREWACDLTMQQTVQFTPGFAPPEQMGEYARRGPGTDFYALCATIWTLIVGVAPPSAPERVAGQELPSLAQLCPGIPLELHDAIVDGLHLKLDERPRSAQQLLDVLQGKPEDFQPDASWEKLDLALYGIQKLRFGKRECPSCGEVLSFPKALKAKRCIVCRDGTITERDLNERICANCHVGLLRRVDNTSPLRFCPVCSIGRLSQSGLSLPWAEKEFGCDRCGAKLAVKGEQVKLPTSEDLFTWEELRLHSRRSEIVWACEQCYAQFDELPDRRWHLFYPEHREQYQTLYPQDWARIAHYLDPEAGNALCNQCGADYFLENDQITLLKAMKDPYLVADGIEGRLLTLFQASWVGAGKTSGHPGCRCDDCGIEFDSAEEGYWQLVRGPIKDTSGAEILRNLTGESETLPDWHRRARGLPTLGEEHVTEQLLNEALLRAYTHDELGPKNYWQGKCKVDGKSRKICCDADGVTLGAMLGKKVFEYEALESATSVDEHSLTLLPDQIEIWVEELLLEVDLKSGRRVLRLGAYDLADRINFEISRR